METFSYRSGGKPRNATESHTTQQTSHKRFTGRGETQEGSCLCLGEKQQGTNCTEARAYVELLGERVELLRVEIFRVGIGGTSSPKLELFTLWGRGRVQLLGLLSALWVEPGSWKLSREGLWPLCALGGFTLNDCELHTVTHLLSQHWRG